MKLILDLDTGIDDAMALAYAVGSPDLELIGVTGTYGNVYTEVGVQNVLNLLEMMGKPEIPVFLGEKKALTQDVLSVMKSAPESMGKMVWDRWNCLWQRNMLPRWMLWILSLSL